MAAFVLAAILFEFAALHASLDRDPVAWRAEYLSSDTHQFSQALLRDVFGNGLRRLVFLDMQMVGIDVDRRRIVGQVGVVGAETFDAFAFQFRAQVLQVFLDAIAQAECSFAKRRLRLRLGTGCEDFEAIQCAGECAIEQRVTLVGFQPDRMRQRFVGRDQGCPPAAELALQQFTKGDIRGRGSAVVFEALTIGRIGDDEAGGEAFGAMRFLDVVMMQAQETGDAGLLRVLLGRGEYGTIAVRSEIARAVILAAVGCALFGLVEQRLPKLRLMAAPTKETIVRAQQAGRDIGGHQRSLDQQGAGAAHRIDQCAAVRGDLRPAGAQQHRRGEILLQWRDAGIAAIAALVQRPTGQIERDLCHRAAHQHMHAQVGRVGVDIRSFAADLTQAVDDGVLHALLRELRIAQAVVHAMRVDRDRAGRRDVSFPCKLFHGGVKTIGADFLDLQQRHQDAARETRPQTGAVGGLERAFEVHAGNGLLDLAGAERREFVREQFFEALRAGGEKRHQRTCP